MAEQPERMDLQSFDIVDDKQRELLRLFPEVRTEGGKIDFDRLKLALGEVVDVGRERYGMNWPGKADCFKTIQTPSLGTLLPCPAESVNFDTTENLIIEGDNLEVMKLMQKAYLGQVKLIYMDPPYNGGYDLVYPDDCIESLQTYLEFTGQVDAGGKRFSTNTEADGRFHSKWLNMMYSRLYLARSLLRSDGVMFISIDDNEADNLRKLCAEIFGEENFIADIAVVNNLKGRNDKRYIARANERVLMYVKSYEFEDQGLPLPDERVAEFKEMDDIGPYRFLGLRKRGGADTKEKRPKMFFPIYVNPLDESVSLKQSNTHSIEVLPRKSDGSDGCWRWGLSTVKKRLGNLVGKVVEGDGRYDVFEKDYLETDGVIRRLKPKSVMAGTAYSTDGATKALRELMSGLPFSNPKPVPFLSDLIGYSTLPDERDIVLDLFAGSGTTAQAVLELNREDGGNRRFILAQLPEPLDPLNKDQKVASDYCDAIGKPRSIAEITKERVRRVIKQLNDTEATDSPSLFDEGSPCQDYGFRVFKLAESNFKPWNADIPNDANALVQQLELHIDYIRKGRKQEDLLYELLLKSGFPLTVSVEELQLADQRVYSVAEGELFICLERDLTLELIRAMAERKPQRVVCLDEGFAGNDQLKANAVQLFKTENVISFKTV